MVTEFQLIFRENFTLPMKEFFCWVADIKIGGGHRNERFSCFIVSADYLK